MISSRNTRLYGSQPQFVVFSCKTAALGPEWQVSMGLRPHLWFFAFKRASLAPQLIVSMCPRPHLWFLHTKQQCFDQNYQSLWDPALICGFWMQNSDFRTKIRSFYGYQTSPMFFAFETGNVATKLQVSMGPRSHLLFFSCKTAWIAPELLVSMGRSPHLWFYAFTTATLWPELISLWVPDLICRLVHAKWRD